MTTSAECGIENAEPVRRSLGEGGWAFVMTSLARGVALFFGLFGVLNVIGRQQHPGFDINIWWLDVRWFRSSVGSVLLSGACVLLVAMAVRLRMRRWRLIATCVAIAWLAAVAAANTWTFYSLRYRGSFAGGSGMPLSLLEAVVFVWLLTVVIRYRNLPRGRPVRRAAGVVFFACVMGIGFPLAQMLFFGKTSYARKVHAIVVFGAGVYPDGQMSLALYDRMRTACDLYNEGLADWLIVSGGPGMGEIHETEAMYRAAVKWGVPADRILGDPEGLNTDATVMNTARIFADMDQDINTILAVSHWYHLPRIKMTYQRAGMSVLTTPARESRTLRRLPYYLAREVAAVWVYYLRPLSPF